MTHVLIVEDHEENRNLLKMLLEANGYRVTAAGDGLEALAAARRDPPDAVVSDVLMPKMDGFALCRAWMQDARLKDIPFIFYSATYARSEDERFGLALGAVRYLIKPLEAQVLLAELRTVLQQCAGHAAPAPHSPLDEITFHALHESALTRTIENKIAQLEAANRKLQESEEKYRRIYDNLQDVYVEATLEGTVLEVSPQIETLSRGQYKREDFIGKSLKAFYADPQQREAILLAIGQQGRANDMESMFRNRDGSLVSCSVSATIVRGADGKLRTVSTMRDITERKRAESALRESEVQLRGILESTAEGILAVDGKGKVIRANKRFSELWRIPKPLLDAGDDQALLDFVLNQLNDPEAFVKKVHALYASETADMDTLTFKDGRIFERHSSPLILDGAILGRVWSFRDITESKNATARIEYLNRVYAVLSDINTLIVRVRDRDELFKKACRIAVERGGFHIALIAIVDRNTMTIAPVASAGVDERFLTLLKDRFSLVEGAPLGNPVMTRAIKEKKTVVVNDLRSSPEVVFRKRYAETGIRSVTVLPLIVSDEAVGVLVLYANEVEFFQEEELKLLTELAGDIAYAIDHIDKQERLDYLAYYDVLTGLANRSLFLDRVTQYMRSAASGGHKLAVFLIDLERFKNINDSLGRDAGDALLRQVAEWLTLKVGDANLLARVGADHFALVMPEVKQEGNLARFLEKWMDVFLEHPYRLNDAVFRIALKVGIAVFPDDGADADTLFRNAEAALKKSKANGERYLFYTQKMTEAVAGKLTLENRLRGALDNGEFVLHYQPKVNLVSQEITGAEALIRWNDPRTGLVPPGRFIPVLEEIGLIYDVGRWALRQTIEDYLRWRAAGLPAVRIAVNVSPLQLRHRGFIDEIRQAIGIDAQAAAGLELEITESLIMEDVKHNIANLQAIRDLGVSIAIDDFGTGFSSLAYLAKLPVDTLKIDRSFVIEMTVAPEGLALVSTVIKLAHSLKLKVVAEGVETEEQSRLLRLLACDEMQGFLYSKPVPVEIFETQFLALPPGDRASL